MRVGDIILGGVSLWRVFTALRLNESIDWGESVDSERSKDWSHYLENNRVRYIGVRVVKGEIRRNQPRRQKELLEVGGRPGKCSILEFKWRKCFWKESTIDWQVLLVGPGGGGGEIASRFSDLGFVSDPDSGGVAPWGVRRQVWWGAGQERKRRKDCGAQAALWGMWL